MSLPRQRPTAREAQLLVPARPKDRGTKRVVVALLGSAMLVVAISCGGGPAAPNPVAPGPAPSPAAGCAFTISSSTVNLGATAGPTSLTVSTGTTCVWTVTSDSAFLTVTSGAGHTGPGNITFTVAENTGALRVATLTIGDSAVHEMVRVNQAAPGPALMFNPATPPGGVVGVPYNFSFAVATGGVEPIHYQLETAGGFPPIGLVLAPNGVLSGVPTVVNPGALFSVCAVDATGRSVCQAMRIAISQADSGAFGNWLGTITLQAGCVDPLPFVYAWSGPIRRNAGGGVELVLSIRLLDITNEVLAVTLTGNTISFGYDYGPWHYDYVGTLSSDQRSVHGTFTGTGCNPPLNTQQSGTWTGLRQ
jgi:hypothetical protein